MNRTALDYLKETKESRELMKKQNLTYAGYGVYKDKQDNKFEYDSRSKRMIKLKVEKEKKTDKKLDGKEILKNKSKIKYFGVVRCFDRSEDYVSKVSMELDTNDLKIVAAILAYAVFFRSKEEAMKDYEDSKTNNEKPQFYYNTEGSIFNKSKTGIAVTAEEWFGGFGKTPNEAKSMFVKAQANEPDEEEGEDW